MKTTKQYMTFSTMRTGDITPSPIRVMKGRMEIIPTATMMMTKVTTMRPTRKKQKTFKSNSPKMRMKWKRSN